MSDIKLSIFSITVGGHVLLSQDDCTCDGGYRVENINCNEPNVAFKANYKEHDSNCKIIQELKIKQLIE